MSRPVAPLRPLRITAAACLLFVLGTCCPVLAQTQGQSDLDEATQLKLNADTMADLERVVELCESALQKGLDDQSAQLAKSLLTATLYQHASRFAQAIFSPRERSDRWPTLREFALQDLEKALQYDDSLPEIHILVARLEALPRGNREKGKASADRAVELAEEKEMQSQALVVRAGYQADTEQGFADLDRAIELDPNNVDAWRLRGLTRLAQSQRLAQQNQVEAAKAEQRKAIEDFMKLLEENPQDLQALQAVAELLGNLGDFEQALEHLEEAITLNPQSPSAYRIRARIHVAQKEYDKALQDLNRAFDLKPDDYEVLLERSQVHMRKGDAASAREDVDRALEIEPNLLQAVLQRSVVAVRQGEYDDAIRDLKRVIQAVDVSSNERTTGPGLLLRLQLGQVYVLADQPAQAIEVFNEILQKDPGNDEVLIQLGNIYLVQLQRPRKAIEAFSAVLEKDPQNSMALRGRADAYLSVGKHAEAIADYEAAVRVDPENDGVLNNLAWVLATSPKDEIRNAERAIQLATKACEVTDYQQAHILSTLAAAFAEQGDFKKAIEWSAKAVELDKAQDDEREIEEQLRQELESYKQGKPWRELQEVDESDAVPGDAAPRLDDLEQEDGAPDDEDRDTEDGDTEAGDAEAGDA